jgi:hypothetical protein
LGIYSENKKKLSYTPKPLSTPLHSRAVFTRRFYQDQQEFLLLNWDSSCWWKWDFEIVGIRNNQNIFRRISTNNSENKKKLSYTPKPLSTPPSFSSCFYQAILPGPIILVETKKRTNKKCLSFQYLFILFYQTIIPNNFSNVNNATRR